MPWPASTSPGSCADAVPRTGELTLDAAVSHRGFCLASRRTSSRISSGTGGRPAVAHLYLKRAKADSIAFGTLDAHRAALASLVNLPPP